MGKRIVVWRGPSRNETATEVPFLSDDRTGADVAEWIAKNATPFAAVEGHYPILQLELEILYPPHFAGRYIVKQIREVSYRASKVPEGALAC